MRYGSEVLIAATSCLSVVSGFLPGPQVHKPGSNKAAQITKRQLPAEPVGIESIVSPSGANITFKNPGAEGVCETTPDVQSYAGFINLAPDVHSFVSLQIKADLVATNSPVVLVV